MIVYQPQHLLWGWLNSRMKVPASEDFRAIGNVFNDCLLAVVGYNAFVGRSCYMHIAIDEPKALTRTFVRAAFDYPFNQAKCSTVFAMIQADNAKSLRLAGGMGFAPMTTIPGHGDEPELCMLVMRRDDCKWIGEPSDRRNQRRSAALGRQAADS